MAKIKLNLGCGIALLKDYINVDLYNPKDLKSKKGIYKHVKWPKGAKYIQCDIQKMPFPDNYADEVQLFEVLEHLSFRRVVPTLIEIRRVMKKGATLYLHVPCFDGLMRDWMELIAYEFDAQMYVYVMETIFGNQRAGGEFHQTAFNKDFLNYCLTQAGFRDGKMYIIRKNQVFPPIGSEKNRRKATARNETLFAEVRK